MYSEAAGAPVLEPELSATSTKPVEGVLPRTLLALGADPQESHGAAEDDRDPAVNHVVAEIRMSEARGNALIDRLRAETNTRIRQANARAVQLRVDTTARSGTLRAETAADVSRTNARIDRLTGPEQRWRQDATGFDPFAAARELRPAMDDRVRRRIHRSAPRRTSVLRRLRSAVRSGVTCPGMDRANSVARGACHWQHLGRYSAGGFHGSGQSVSPGTLTEGSRSSGDRCRSGTN